MKIGLGADHGGFKLKQHIINFLKNKRYEIVDYGTDSPESCDYPDFGFKVAKAVSKGTCDKGILICKSGLGMSIVANKIYKVRAALCRDMETVISSRKHNDANILVLAANFTDNKSAEKWIDKWLSTEFEGGRHARRIKKITQAKKNISM